MISPLPVAVVGAGLGGLTAALALLRAGWPVRVFERAAVLGEVGAGISLSAGAGRALATLGVGPALLAASLPVPDVAFADWRSGALLAGSFDRGQPEDRGFDTARHVHRADLHAILVQAVRDADPAALQTGRRLLRVDDEGNTVQACFADGSRFSAGLLVAADGTRSVVREQLFDPGAPRFAGQVAYRCLVPRERAAPHLGQGHAVVTVGPGRIFHRYLLRRGALVNVVGIVRGQGWHDEGWNTPATREAFADAFAGFGVDVLGLIGCAPDTGLIKWGLFERPPLARWHRGVVTLLGDAAHPILPFLGLGAALAIEDGFVLARALRAAPDVSTALAAFQAARAERVETVRLQSMAQGEAIQAADSERGDLRRAPAQDSQLFDYDPLSAPLAA